LWFAWRVLETDSVLSPQARDALLSYGRPRQFRIGEVIFHQGDPCDSLFLLRSGRAAVQVVTPDGDQATLGLLVAPEEFGEVGLLRDDHHHTATVTALEDVCALTVSAKRFHELRIQYPELTEWLLLALADRLERASQLLTEALFLDADRRVARRLLDCHRAFDTGEPGRLPIRQDDIAAMAGVARPTANRALRRLEECGAVRLGRRRIEIVDLAELTRAAT
jgi:CRP-like cAMP-binding protein